jgi:uncharacterized protein involved in outer membrane biogenesis
MVEVGGYWRFSISRFNALIYNRPVKRLFKWLLRLILLVVVLVVLVLVFKDSMLRVAAENRIRAQTGMDVKIGKFSSGIFSPVVTIENLKIYNTAEFGGTPFLDIPELHIELDSIALTQHKLRVTLVRLNLAELDVVKNEAGQTNLYRIKNKAEGAGSKKNGLQDALGNFQFDGIDVLNLSLGKAKFIDLKEAKHNREIRVDLQNQIFKNVKSDADVYGVLFLVWLRSGGAFSITPVDLGRDFIGKKLEKTETTLRQTVGNATVPTKK